MTVGGPRRRDDSKQTASSSADRAVNYRASQWLRYWMSALGGVFAAGIIFFVGARSKRCRHGPVSPGAAPPWSGLLSGRAWGQVASRRPLNRRGTATVGGRRAAWKKTPN